MSFSAANYTCSRCCVQCRHSYRQQGNYNRRLPYTQVRTFKSTRRHSPSILVRLCLLTATIMTKALRDVAQCFAVETGRRFRAFYFLHLSRHPGLVQVCIILYSSHSQTRVNVHFITNCCYKILALKIPFNPSKQVIKVHLHYITYYHCDICLSFLPSYGTRAHADFVFLCNEVS
jgi:hypothetical protein